MAKQNYTSEQIIVKLREVELHCGQGKGSASGFVQRYKDPYLNKP